MKRIPLKRKTPLKRTGWLKWRSKGRHNEEKEYAIRRKEFMVKHPFCEACLTLNKEFKKPRFASEVHHMAGREHSLLLDQAYWLAVCRVCHVYIENNGKHARVLGFVVDKPVEMGLKSDHGRST